MRVSTDRISVVRDVLTVQLSGIHTTRRMRDVDIDDTRSALRSRAR